MAITRIRRLGRAPLKIRTDDERIRDGVVYKVWESSRLICGVAYVYAITDTPLTQWIQEGKWR